MEAQWFEAARAADIDKLANLLAKGQDVNVMEVPRGGDDKQTFLSALMLCTAANSMDAVSFLLNNGAVIQKKDGSALTYAVYKGRIDIARFLITKGAQLNYKNKMGAAAIHLGVIGASMTAEKLEKKMKKEKEKDPNFSDTELRNQLDSSLKSYLECTKLLTLCGADVNVHNEKGQTALQLAAHLKFIEPIHAFLSDAASIMEEVKREKDDQDRTTPTVMISYNWTQQALIKRINVRLKRHGLKVWLDVEQMQGSTISAMAAAVEGADIIIMCVSEQYQASANCRLEAEYALQRKKHIIPLMVGEANFRPSGWLGLILGAKLYYDFSFAQDSGKAPSPLDNVFNSSAPTRGRTMTTEEEEKSRQLEHKKCDELCTGIDRWLATKDVPGQSANPSSSAQPPEAGIEMAMETGLAKAANANAASEAMVKQLSEQAEELKQLRRRVEELEKLVPRVEQLEKPRMEHKGCCLLL